MLRHAVALTESVTPGGEADLGVYEKLLAKVRVSGPRTGGSGHDAGGRAR
jgi:hypothetical protein